MSEWSAGKYHTHRRSVGFLTLVVMWRSRDAMGDSGYEARIEQCLGVVGRFPTAEEAKAAVEAHAHSLLTDALAKLDAASPEPSTP